MKEKKIRKLRTRWIRIFPIGSSIIGLTKTHGYQSKWMVGYVSHLHSFWICSSLQQNVRDNQNCQQGQVINQCYFCHHLPDLTSRLTVKMYGHTSLFPKAKKYTTSYTHQYQWFHGYLQLHLCKPQQAERLRRTFPAVKIKERKLSHRTTSAVPTPRKHSLPEEEIHNKPVYNNYQLGVMKYT